MSCKHEHWKYQQELPGVATRSLAQQRDNGNTNIRTCQSCGLEQHKEWVGPVYPMLGAKTLCDAIEALAIVEEMRQDEGVSILFFCDNPDFGGADAAIEVHWDFAEMPTRFSGDTVLTCLRAALQAHKARANV